VLLGRTGPVVIDWANARAGEPELDVALSVVITGGTRPGQPLTLLRDLFVREFVRCFAREEWSGAWDRAVAYRRADRNVSDAEKALVGRLRF
jgi:hypothetical protein